MPTAPIPLASYLASLTMNFYDLANVRATGDAVIEVVGGNGSVSIPVAQGVQGYSMYAGATLPTSSSPAGAVPMDKYTLTATDGAGNPGDVYRKASDNTWALIGSIRGAAGHPVFVGTTVPTTLVPAGAVTGDLYLYLGTGTGNPGDVYVKASGGTWSVSGSQRGPAGPSGAASMQDRGAWAATTAYASGDVVTNGGQRWLVKTAHTSGSTFSGATNWIPLTLPASPPESAVTDLSSTFASGWGNYPSWAPLGYQTIGTRVFLRGMIYPPSSSMPARSVAFTLPTGVRPAVGPVSFMCAVGAQFGRVDVGTDGTVTFDGAVATSSACSISGINFSTI